MAVSDRVGGLLNYIDNQIDPVGINCLKFSLYPLLKVQWKEVDKFTKPSEIFHALESTQKSQKDTFAIFLFALRAIGGKKRGKSCAQEAERKLSPDLIPTPLDFGQLSREFQLFSWLLKIERRLPDECREIVIQDLAKVGTVSHHVPEFQTLPQLFIRLYQSKKLTVEDTSVLSGAIYHCKQVFTDHTLIQCGLDKCLSYLRKFDSEEEDLFSTGDNDSTAQSMHEPTKKGRPKRIRHHSERRSKQNSQRTCVSLPAFGLIEKDSTDTAVPKETENSIEESLDRDELTESLLFHPTSVGTQPCSGTLETFSRETVPTISEGAAENFSINRNPNQGLTRSVSVNTQHSTGFQQHRRKMVFAGMIGLALLVACVMGIPLCNKYVWSPLNTMSPHEVQHREKNAPILSEFWAFFVKQVSVEQEIDYFDDSFHNIKVFLAHSSCHDLPTLTTVDEYTETSELRTETVYMLKNSEIILHASATTGSVESNPVMFYITKTVENYIHFDPHNPDTIEYHKGIQVGTKGNKKYSDISYRVKEHDYYSVIIVVHQGQSNVTLNYNLTMNIKQLDIDSLNSSVIGIIEHDSDEKEIEKSISLGNSQYCLFADIMESTINSTYNYITIETHLQPRHDAGVGVTVSALIAFFALMMGAQLLMCSMLKKAYNRWHLHGYQPVQSIS